MHGPSRLSHDAARLTDAACEATSHRPETESVLAVPVALVILALLIGCESPATTGKSCQVPRPGTGTGPGGCLPVEDAESPRMAAYLQHEDAAVLRRLPDSTANAAGACRRLDAPGLASRAFTVMRRTLSVRS